MIRNYHRGRCKCLEIPVCTLLSCSPCRRLLLSTTFYYCLCMLAGPAAMMRARRADQRRASRLGTPADRRRWLSHGPERKLACFECIGLPLSLVARRPSPGHDESCSLCIVAATRNQLRLCAVQQRKGLCHAVPGDDHSPHPQRPDAIVAGRSGYGGRVRCASWYRGMATTLQHRVAVSRPRRPHACRRQLGLIDGAMLHISRGHRAWRCLAAERAL